MSIKKKLSMAVASLAIGAMLVGGGTYALFTAEAKNEENTFSTGTLTIETVDANGTTIESPVFDIVNLLPGETDADHGGKRHIYVQNNGTADAWVRVSGISSGDHSGHVTVEDLFDGPFPLTLHYEGNTDGHGPGKTYYIAAGDKQLFEFGFTFDEEADNEYQDKSAQFTILFQAVQAKNNTNASNEGPIYWSNDEI